MGMVQDRVFSFWTSMWITADLIGVSPLAKRYQNPWNKWFFGTYWADSAGFKFRQNQPNMLCNIDSNASRNAACSAWRGGWKQMDQYTLQDGIEKLTAMFSLADSMAFWGRNAQPCPAVIMLMMVDRSGAVQIILGCNPAAAKLSFSQRFCRLVSWRVRKHSGSRSGGRGRWAHS